MDSMIELFAAGQWHRAATLSVTPHSVRLEYLPEYVFGEGGWPVALSLPVNMETRTAGLSATGTPLAFLWDLVPQGCGLQYLAGLMIDDWNEVLHLLALDKEVKAAVADTLGKFVEGQLPKLADELRKLDADVNLVEACRLTIKPQIRELQEVRGYATPAP